MSKKEPKKPYKDYNNKWCLDGKILDCHSCIYYNDGRDSDVLGGYCEYHRFKFEYDLSPGSDYSQCERFSYNEDSGGLGLVGNVIIVLIIIFIFVIFSQLCR